MDAVQPALDAVHAQRLLVGFVARHRHDAAPDAGRAGALDLEQIEPLVRIGKVVARAVAVAGADEIEAGGDLDEALFPGEAFELDLGELAHGAAAAVGADDIGAAQRLGFAGRVGDGDVDMIGVLGKAGEPGGEAHLGKPARLDHRQRSADKLVLLPLQHERIRHRAFEHADVEYRDQFAAGAVAEMEQRRLQPARGVLGEGLRPRGRDRRASPRSADARSRRADPRPARAPLPSAAPGCPCAPGRAR